MILECSCGKMYRIRDDAANPPTKCPACGGPLKSSGSSSPDVLAQHPRVREMETRIKDLQRQVEEARSAAPAEAPKALAEQVDELRAGAEKAGELERELLDLRSQTERRLKDKERETAQAREAADRAEAERRKVESRVAGIEEKQAAALAEKQKTIETLDASLSSYRQKVEQLQKRVDQAELQRMADLQSFEGRLRERESKDRAALEENRGAQQRALAEARKELEGQLADKDREITESRQLLDREAGERRRLSEVLSRLQQNADRTLKEKDATIKALEAGAGSNRSKLEALQKRVSDLEQLRRSEADQYSSRMRAREGLKARVQEADLLASDLDRSLDSTDALLKGLQERVKRLKDSLQYSEPEAPAVPAGHAFAPAPPQEEPSRPALSQADAFGALLSPAAAPVEEPALEEIASAPPAPRAAPPAEEEADSLRGRTDAPSEISLPAVREEEQEDEPPLEELPADEPAPVETAAEEPAVEDAVPLISPPEDEPAPPPAAPKEEPADKKRPRFSWKRK